MSAKDRDERSRSGAPPCSSMSEQLTLLLDDELSGDGRATIEAHLAGCDGCRRELHARRRLRREWSTALTADSSAEERSTVIAAARAALTEERAPWWQRFVRPAPQQHAGVRRSIPWRRPLSAALQLDTLVTATAVACTLVLAVRLWGYGKQQVDADRWGSSTAIYYGELAHTTSEDEKRQSLGAIPKPF